MWARAIWGWGPILLLGVGCGRIGFECANGAAGCTDTGPVQELDAGPGDSGPDDAGPDDAGPDDAGPGDAGPPVVLDAGHPTLSFECEAGTRLGAVEVVDDGVVRATRIPTGTPEFRIAVVGVPPPHAVRYQLDVPEAGTYWVYVRMLALDDARDALELALSATDAVRVFPDVIETDYQWVSESEGVRHQLTLPAGPVTLYVNHAEQEVRCDRFVLTTDPAYTP